LEAPTQQVEVMKRTAAERAVALVIDGMRIGLGTGSTARYFIDAVGRRVQAGLRVQAVATSEETGKLAAAGGIPLIDDLEVDLDLAVDGADEIDPDLNCLKGRGGALLREKLVAHASRRFILIADETKLVANLGRGPVPIEVLPFLWQVTARSIRVFGGAPELRLAAGKPFETDNGNYVIDSQFASVDASLAAALKALPGVLEHGIFIGMAGGAIVGTSSGCRLMGDLD
jgi:ribose 5-phosphate isomerase A